MKFLTNTLFGFWNYISEQQSFIFRWVHITLAGCVLLQIIDSNFMHVKYALMFFNIGTIIHIIVGILTSVLALLLVFLSFKKRGLKYYYPYIWMDFQNLKKDFLTIMSLKLPNAKPKGLAAIVQGFGLISIILVCFTGVAWLVFWYFDFPNAHEIQNIHKTTVGLLEAYIIGHPLMGFMHYLMDKYYPQSLEDKEVQHQLNI